MQQYDKIRKFWDKKAKKYPLPYDASVYQRTIYVLDRIRKMGCSFFQKEVLEIGAGTGVYTIPIAKESKRIVAIDPSDEMLNILIEQTKLYNIGNIEIIKAFWQEIEIEERKFKKAFDVVISAMTPAIKTEEDLVKMEDCSKKWCIYVGWGRKRENKIKAEIFRIHGLELKPPQGVLRINEILTKMGRHTHLEFFETSWQWRGCIEEAIEDISSSIELKDRRPKRNEIYEFLKNKFPNGNVTYTTFAEQGFLLWEV